MSVGAVGLVFLAGVGLLSLSDRAPGYSVVGLRRGRSLVRSIEARSGHNWLDRSDIPLAWDTAGHLALWAVAGLLTWAALGRRLGAPFIIVGLISLSAGIEVAQVLLSSTRMAELSDVAANGAGVTLGVLCAMAIGRVVDLSARGVRRVRSLTR